jgi:hypothetical protein
MLFIMQVRITGGLGNQLFQYFAGLKLCEKYLTKLSLDVSYYRLNQKYRFKNQCDLLGYDVVANSHQNHDRFPRTKRELISILASLSTEHQKRLGYLTDSSYDLIDSRRTHILDGYFQDRTFLPELNTIEAKLELNESQRNDIAPLRSRISQEGPILIHIRRGDYLEFNSIYGVLDQEYYRRGCDVLFDRIGKRPIWLASDDVQGALAWLDRKIPISKILDSNKNHGSILTLELMSGFPGIITANSTFSWWAAFLGTSRGTTQGVVIPKKFTLIDKIDTSSKLAMNGWNVL